MYRVRKGLCRPEELLTCIQAAWKLVVNPRGLSTGNVNTVRAMGPTSGVCKQPAKHVSYFVFSHQVLTGRAKPRAAILFSRTMAPVVPLA